MSEENAKPAAPTENQQPATDEIGPHYLLGLEIDDFKKIRVFRMKPSGERVRLIGGGNAQGKSSILDAVSAAFGGDSSVPPRAVRVGAKKARVMAAIGPSRDGPPSHRITRTISATSGKPYLKVEDAQGKEIGSPQKFLNRLTDERRILEPMAWLAKDATAQAEDLSRIAGLDTKECQKTEDAAYQARTLVNHEVKGLASQVEAIPADPEAPTEEVSIADLSAQLEAAQKSQQRISSERSGLNLVESRMESIQKSLAKIAEQRRILDEEEANQQKHMDTALAARSSSVQALAEAEAKAIDPAPIKAQIQGAEETNRRARKQAERRRLVAALVEAKGRADRLTRTITDAQVEKAKRIQEAKFPIEGLSVGDQGVTFNGLPLEQASQAEQLRVAVAVAAEGCANLMLLLVREGSRLDENGLRLLAQEAARYDLDVMCERVGNKDPGAIIIEDGEVVES